MITTTHIKNDRVFGLLEAWRGRNDQRAIERIISLNRRILNYLVRQYASSSNEPHEDLAAGYRGDCRDLGSRFS